MKAPSAPRSVGERARRAVGAQQADTAPHDRRRRAVGYAAAIGAAAFAGLIPVVAKRDLGGVEPLLVAGLTNGFAAAALVPFVPRPSFARADLRLLAVIALLGVVVAPLLYFTGLRHTSATEAAMLVNVETVGTLVFAVVLLRERAGALEIAAVLAVVGGAVVLVTDLGAGVDLAHIGGNFLIVIGAVLWALDNTVSAGLVRRNRPLAVAAWKNVVGASIVLAIAAAAGADFRALTEHWSSFVAAGAVGIGVSLTLFYVSLRHIDAYRTSAIFGLQGVFGAAGGFLLLGERLSVAQLGGAAVMVAAVFALALLHRPREAQEAGEGVAGSARDL